MTSRESGSPAAPNLVTGPPDYYAREAAAYLLSRLDSADPGGELIDRESFGSSGDDRSAVLGVSKTRTPSTYPSWYSRWVVDAGYRGQLVRDALACLARGERPRTSQREARWIMERIDDARASGDVEMDLPPQIGRGDRQGGARPGIAQAVLSRVDGSPVSRVPVRAPAETLARLREQAAARGVTLNSLLVEILTRHVETTCPDPTDETPF